MPDARPAFSKSERAALKAAASLAYERELSEALEEVEHAFTEWRAGSLSAWEVSEAIHAFHQGPARELYRMYGALPDHLIVMGALRRGVLAVKDVSAGLVRRLRALGRLAEL